MQGIPGPAPFLYFSASDDGTLLHVNQELCAETGFSETDLVGHKIDVLLTVATRIFYQTHLFPLMRMQGRADEIFITIKTKDKEDLPVLVNARRSGAPGAEQNGFAGIVVHNRKRFEDELVAARKAAEQALHENIELLRAREQLQQHAEQLDHQMHRVSRQNEEWLQFSRVVTHDLQEPLRKLFVFINNIGEGNEVSTPGKIGKIRSAAEQMRSIVSGLQQYVWLTEARVKYTLVDVAELLEDIKGQLHNDFPGVRINIETAGHLILEADKEQMLFFFYQLLYNSVRFRSREDEANIRVSGITLFLNKFKNLSEKYKYTENIRLELADDGIGFDETYNEQVFELFKRLHKNSGRGVGLALCKKIADNHNGSISIRSKPGSGAVVTVVLPLRSEDSVIVEENKKFITNERATEDDTLRGG